MNLARTKGGTLALVATALAMGGCGDTERASPAPETAGPAATPEARPRDPSTDWQLDVSSRGGARLLFPASALDAGEDPVVLLTCVPSDRLIVRLPRVIGVGSEERLSIGDGDMVVAMVADRTRGAGVAARGPTPDDLDAMLEGGFAAAYGATSVGRLPPVPADLRARFRAACKDGSSPVPSGKRTLSG